MIDVVAGIIWKDGRILLARRGKQKHLAGKWEFPGGKIELGESAEIALERELKEELSIQTRTEDFFDLNIHHYSSVSIKLQAYNSAYISGEICLSDHDKIEWVEIQDLLKYDFAEADIPLVYKLMQKFGYKDIN
ncbi:(deoxy)nucleoside triphosphate pyrophosphohydrolase [Larkinella rosea]|uniref:8-oxo-dGTP diphosphatase n=1 Tax=Larkinella rosea TaxID=2025312 RepID=A0A3P1BEB7_9BACT|nr:(deoxy)nucleoside triphosphate pyrophosphohydrolase [Larkinella rosea]RRA99212.1 (deoxy)nucleoside triphosphate pyrophosphohydrolase [Larkinella rosea]